MSGNLGTSAAKRVAEEYNPEAVSVIIQLLLLAGKRVSDRLHSHVFATRMTVQVKKTDIS